MHIENFSSFINPDNYDTTQTIRFSVCRDESDRPNCFEYGDYVLYFDPGDIFTGGKFGS